MQTMPYPKFRAIRFQLALTLAVLFLAACQPLTTPPPLITPVPSLTPTVNVPATATPPATLTPTITPLPPAGAISGLIWHDLCEPGKDGQPQPVEPPAGCVRAPDGTYRANSLFDSGEPRLGGVKVRLGAGQCPSVGLAETIASADAGYTFTGLPAGTYCISVDASLEPNFSLLTPGHWTYPVFDAGSQTVTLGADEGKGGVNFGWDYQLLPNNPCVYRAAFVADVTIPDNSAINAGQSFVKTWRVRNTGTCAWGPGYPVNALVFSGGVNLAGADRVAIPSVVAAGATVDLSVSMTAPNTAGTQRSEWKLALENGGLLGVGATADQPLFAQIVVPQRATATPTVVKPVIQAFGISPTRVRRGDPVTLTWATTNAQDVFLWRLDDRGRLAEPNGLRVPASGSRVMDLNDPLNRTYSFFLSATTAGQTVSATARPEIICETAGDARCSSANWRGEYFNNRNLSGSPVVVRDDANLDFNWGPGAPLPNFPADSFSVRWTRSLTFNQGTYRFRALADDGVRVFVDEQLVIDDWRDGGAGEVTGEASLAAGNHNLRVEFYENAGDANFRLTWEVVGSPSFPDWKGEYWNNRTFNGAPVLVRNDRTVDFDWGNNAPAAGLPADDFSVRWSRWITFDPGVYRFTVNADDGVRVYVDGQLILDEWREQDLSRTFTAERALTGPRPVVVEYFERGGRAAVKVRWERLPDTPTPTPTTAPPTATPTPTATVPPTATPTATASPTVTPTQFLESSVSGQVWQDVCAQTGQPFPGPGELPAGCAIGAGDLLRGNGVKELGEAGIAGVTLLVSEGLCGTVGIDVRVVTAVTDANGRFSVAGLRGGPYCLSVDPNDARNAPLLIPGLWTNLGQETPNTAVAFNFSLIAGEAKTNLDLGWDFLNRP